MCALIDASLNARLSLLTSYGFEGISFVVGSGTGKIRLQLAKWLSGIAPVRSRELDSPQPDGKSGFSWPGYGGRIQCTKDSVKRATRAWSLSGRIFALLEPISCVSRSHILLRGQAEKRFFVTADCSWAGVSLCAIHWEVCLSRLPTRGCQPLKHQLASYNVLPLGAGSESM